jgi:hypothetical protein
MPKTLYVFLDEAGNFDFSPTGTKYFMLGSIALQRPFGFSAPLSELKLDLLEAGLEIERFHATEDKQPTRDKVFEIITRNLSEIRIDSTIVEKRKTGPALRVDCRFYPELLGYHLRYVLQGYALSDFTKVVVITDAIPVSGKRKAIEKAIKGVLATKLPRGVDYLVLHHESKSNIGLQVADYCTWAIYRKWDRGDDRSQRLIASKIQSEFDFFRRGTTFYY